MMAEHDPLTRGQEAELEAWLRGLRGQTPPSDADLRSHAEGQCLQRALSATPVEPPAVSPHELELMLERAEREGLFRATGCQRCRVWREALRDVWRAPAWRWGGAFSGALALSLMVWLGLPQQQPWPVDDGAPASASTSGDGGVTRGSDGVLQLRVPNPLAWREALASDLQAKGLEVRRYERLGRLGLDVELNGLPAERQAPVHAILKRRGLPWPGDGVLMLELSAGPAQAQP
ncbi:MAG: hypothetical protein CFE41_03060 [Burkholderiales bacterium PBB2]|nr:MAG: hypothetical protein CFE41_03060 [Burkholderiales bacterium PBB2]